MVLTSLLLFLLVPLSRAQDAVGLAPGTPTGGLLDAPTTSDAQGLAADTVVVGGLVSHSVAPVSVCAEAVGQAGDCSAGQGTPWVSHSTAVVVSGAQGRAGGWSWGGGLTARLLSSQPGVPEAWAAAAALPWTLQGADRPAVEDLSAFLQKHVFTGGSRHHVAARLQATLDREGAPGLWGGPAPFVDAGAAQADASHVAWLYGSGTGATASAVYTLGGSTAEGGSAPRLRGSVELSGTLRVPPSRRCGDLPCEARSVGLGTPLPTAFSPQLRGGLAVRLTDADQLAALAEARLGTDLVGHLSSEVRGGLRWRPETGGLDLTGLLGVGPTLGLGDPALRMVVGVRWAPRPRAATSSSPSAPPLEALFVARSPSGAVLPLQLGGDLAGVPTRQTPAGETVALLPDTRPLRVRLGAPGHATWVETLALDGTSPVRVERVLPERSGEAHLALSVVDEEGRPIQEVPMLLDGVDLGEVCGTCGVSLEGLAEGGHALVAAVGQAAAVPQQVEAVDAREARSSTPPVFLQRPEGSVEVEVEDADGPRPDARVTVIQAMGEETLRLDAQGRAEVVLPPGRYRVRVVAPGMGAQERSLAIEEGDSRLHAVSVLLLPAAEDGATLDVGLLTAEGTPLGGAAVRLGATLLGETATGGGLRVEGLPAGESVLSVSHPDFRAYPSQPVALVADEELEVLAPLAWKAGSLLLQAVDPAGVPVDARVELRQQGAVTTRERTGPDGLLRARLGPGDWDVVVSAPGRTTTTVGVAVDPERVFAAEAAVVLHALEEDTGVLSVAVSDKAAEPVEGARIFVDGKDVGTTSTGGTLLVEGIEGSAVPLRVEGDLYDPWTGRSQVQRGVQTPTEVRLKERLGLVTVQAQSADGAPLDAFVRLLGPVATVPRRLGPNGQQRYRLPEGFWEVLFSHEAHGLHAEELSVARGAPPEPVVWTPEGAATPGPLARLPRREASLSLWDRATAGPTAGTLRLLGPEVVAPLEVGPDGSWAGPLRLGLWEVLGSAEGLGLGSEDLTVSATGPAPAARISLGAEVVRLENGVLTITDSVPFKVGSAELEASSQPLLAAVARALQTRPEILRVQIEGHTDSVGAPERNRVLSEARAQAVLDALVAQGVSGRRLQSRGFGDTVPVASNETSRGRAENRRVVFRVVETRGQEGGTPPAEVSPATEPGATAE